MVSIWGLLLNLPLRVSFNSMVLFFKAGGLLWSVFWYPFWISLRLLDWAEDVEVGILFLLDFVRSVWIWRAMA